MSGHKDRLNYEVFFQNPSGLSEDIANKDIEEEDDLMMNQNKSAAGIDSDNDNED